MALGDLRGFIQGAGAAISTAGKTVITASAAIAVSIGDVIVAGFGERTALTVTGSTDNIGNTYSAQNAGTDAGNATGRLFYIIATSSGSLSTIGFSTPTASSDDYAGAAAVIEGPFSGIGANPSNATDTATPFVGNAIAPSSGGTYSALISWFACGNGAAGPACATGYTIDVNAASGTGANTVSIALARKRVSSTASDSPSWTVTSGGGGVVGGLSFSSTVAPQAQSVQDHMFVVL